MRAALMEDTKEGTRRVRGDIDRIRIKEGGERGV
jgi:hypothetical protein